jgi:hypothetical protein
MIYLVVRYALEGSRFGAMLVSAGLFAGAALVGVGLVVDIPGILMVAGLGAMLARSSWPSGSASFTWPEQGSSADDAGPA